MPVLLDGCTFDRIPFKVSLHSLKAVARGATASVFVGKTVGNNGLLVAVKVFSNTLDKKYKELLVRELRAVQQVSSRRPSIVPFIGAAAFNLETAIVSLYMRNGNMHDYLWRKGGNKQTLILQVADAVHYLHNEEGLVHGDLKCENILISDSGNALLSDFGLSTTIEKTSSTPPTPTEIRQFYTTRFAAPEVLQDYAGAPSRIRSKTRESDVYAFGMLILETVTGRPPWPGLHDFAVIVKACSGETPPQPTWDGVLPSISHAWWDVCQSCWSLDPRERPPIGQIVAKLQASDISPIRHFEAPGTITSIAYRPDGRRVISLSEGGWIETWNMDSSSTSLTSLRCCPSHPLAAVSPDGRQAAYRGDHEHTAKPRNWWSGRIPKHGDSDCIICRVPTRTRARDANIIHRVDLISGVCIGHPMEGHTKPVSAVAYSSDARRIASGSYDTTIRLWDGSTGALIHRPLRGHLAPIAGLASSPDGTCLASTTRDNLISIWDCTMGTWRASLSGEQRMSRTMSFSPDNAYLYTVHRAESGERLSKWAISSGSLELSIPCGLAAESWTPRECDALAVSPSGKYVATALRELDSDMSIHCGVPPDSSIYIWDVNAGEYVNRPLTESGRVHLIAFHPLGRNLVSVVGRIMTVWDLLTVK